MIIKMLLNPGNITTAEVAKVHGVYRAPIWQSQMKWENQRLLLYEPISNSTKTVRLTVIPKDLRKHILIDNGLQDALLFILLPLGFIPSTTNAK
jgi:hypothetical protein